MEKYLNVSPESADTLASGAKHLHLLYLNRLSPDACAAFKPNFPAA